MKLTAWLRATHLTAAFLIFLAASAQTSFVNAYAKKNADNTLQLAYIEHTSENTTVYVRYLGTQNYGKFTGLYLNNFRIVDRVTGAEYKPTNTGVLPTTTDGKFFIYNSYDPIMLSITFRRLPSYVKSIDLVEADGSTTSTYNFTFRGIAIDPTKDDGDDLWDMLWEEEVYAATIYSITDANIDIYIDDAFVGTLTRYFADPAKVPDCGQYGTLTLLTAESRTLKFKGKASKNGKSLSWTFDVNPKDWVLGECAKHYLKAAL